ncbi:2,3-diketo-5-methylthiopentyl-1-phosphate enolase [Mangrovibacillus cuniculi]|uniref:2,3-diketo-5-methylthiopentyl-1-phosphate enolase n=1 Tax=Mangrovibacillus cuniculi TaxID=2593652 RepID=A0A7S8CA82_9BACI|nr:2,3-diketo-5-methylthiopentyl-1-phosphate enolase [Mangrovibacillus cuniculi]QPC46136.1 2,3-diketo-5-methylthiopentyl-1-phosphate enolase [Mangrovibacillus cuniculi]
MSYIQATYKFPTKVGGTERKAEGIALGMTVGSWTDLTEMDQQQLLRHKGRVVSVTEVEEDSNLFGIAIIEYPTVNFSPDLPAILTTIFGKLSLDGQIRLQNISFSSGLAEQFPGPRYGVKGIRDILGVYDRPLLMSIFKGVIGRNQAYLNQQLEAQCYGGMDLVKEDEILFENELTPFVTRIKEGNRITKKAYEETGHRTLYAVNLTGRSTDLLNKARWANEAGADVLLFNVHAYGLDLLQAIREDEEVHLPIMAHPAVAGAMSGSSTHGIDYSISLGTFIRAAGADFSLFPSPYGSVALPFQDVQNIVSKLSEENVWKPTFAVPSAGIHPGLVPTLVKDFGVDQIINAGGGIHGHPQGALAGVKSFKQALHATLAGESLENAASKHRELKEALQLWG